MTRPLVTALALLALAACSSGRQTLGYASGGDAGSPDGPPDFSADVHLPWYGGPGYHARWPNGLPASPSHVPIGVWMQNPMNAERYRDVGVNLFIGLWEGPTEEQLDGLGAAGLATFCGQEGVWQGHLDDPAVRGWLIETSPDNAQELPDGSYGPCIEPEVTRAEYAAMSEADDSRPVMLLLGQAVADAEWPGRGSCDGRDDMYLEYAEAADVLGFYYYPVARARPLELMATGVERLLEWSRNRKPVLALIEAASIDGAPRPEPAQIRALAWLALASGAAGIGYYCHRFTPDFSETDCLEDEPTREVMTRINGEIRQVAPALNSPRVGNGVVVESDVPIVTRLARVSDATYLFAVVAANESGRARFTLRGFSDAVVDVIGEDRELPIEGGDLSDDFDAYGVHLYRIAH